MAKKSAAKKQSAPAGARDAFRDEMENEEYPDAFMFDNVGDMIVGKVVGFDRAYSKHGPHMVVRIQDETDGEIRSVHVLGTSLKNVMDDANPQVGDRIAVRRREDATVKSGRYAGTEIRTFRVRIDGATANANARSYSDLAARVSRNIPATRARAQGDGDDGDGEDDSDLPF